MRKVAIFIPSLVKNVAQPPSISSQAVADHVVKIITSNNNNDNNKTLHLPSLVMPSTVAVLNKGDHKSN